MTIAHEWIREVRCVGGPADGHRMTVLVDMRGPIVKAPRYGREICVWPFGLPPERTWEGEPLRRAIYRLRWYEDELILDYVRIDETNANA